MLPFFNQACGSPFCCLPPFFFLYATVAGSTFLLCRPWHLTPLNVPTPRSLYLSLPLFGCHTCRLLSANFAFLNWFFCCPFSCPPPLALLTHISACRRVLISMARTRRPRSAGPALPYPPPRLALVIPSIHPVFGQLCACARIHNEREREFVFTLRIRRIALTPVSLSISLPLFLPPSRSLACCMPGTSLVNNSC